MTRRIRNVFEEMINGYNIREIFVEQFADHEVTLEQSLRRNGIFGMKSTIPGLHPSSLKTVYQF